jgi:hypothetical protein
VANCPLSLDIGLENDNSNICRNAGGTSIDTTETGKPVLFGVVAEV